MAEAYSKTEDNKLAITTTSENVVELTMQQLNEEKVRADGALIQEQDNTEARQATLQATIDLAQARIDEATELGVE